MRTGKTASLELRLTEYGEHSNAAEGQVQVGVPTGLERAAVLWRCEDRRESARVSAGRPSRRTLVLPHLFFVALSCAQNASALPKADTGADFAAVERIATDYQARAGIPGLSLAIALDGKVVWEKAFGEADLENHVSALPETLYRTASIGKMFTATAVMQFAERGELDLDEDIRGPCAAFPAKPWPITTRQLLGHLSGIRHYGGPRDHEEQTSTRHFASVTEAMSAFQDDALGFEPGTDYLYSTYGYVVLGCVLEGASGQSYLDCMRERVFVPAGMTSTRDDDPRVILAHRAAGYARVNGELQNATQVDMSNRLPAGGFVSTARDLAAFATALLDGRLVRAETLKEMSSPSRLKNGDTVDYGLGMALWPSEGTATAFFHGGSTPGASGMLLLVPAQRCAVAFLTNLEDAPERRETAQAIAEALRGTAPVDKR